MSVQCGVTHLRQSILLLQIPASFLFLRCAPSFARKLLLASVCAPTCTRIHTQAHARMHVRMPARTHCTYTHLQHTHTRMPAHTRFLSSHLPASWFLSVQGTRFCGMSCRPPAVRGTRVPPAERWAASACGMSGDAGLPLWCGQAAAAAAPWGAPMGDGCCGCGLGGRPPLVLARPWAACAKAW